MPSCGGRACSGPSTSHRAVGIASRSARREETTRSGAAADCGADSPGGDRDGDGESMVRLQANCGDVSPGWPGGEGSPRLRGDACRGAVAEGSAARAGYQAARLFELLPQKPNDLWQMDVTYI